MAISELLSEAFERLTLGTIKRANRKIAQQQEEIGKLNCKINDKFEALKKENEALIIVNGNLSRDLNAVKQQLSKYKAQDMEFYKIREDVDKLTKENENLKIANRVATTLLITEHRQEISSMITMIVGTIGNKVEGARL